MTEVGAVPAHPGVGPTVLGDEYVNDRNAFGVAANDDKRPSHPCHDQAVGGFKELGERRIRGQLTLG